MQSVSEWQRDKEDWSMKKANFVTGCHGNIPLRDRKMPNEVNKPFHLSTNHEILVTIGPLAAEKQVLESRPFKKYIQKNEGKTSAKYIVLLARLPSGLNKSIADNKHEGLAVASIAQDDPCTLLSNDPFPRARMHRDRNAR